MIKLKTVVVSKKHNNPKDGELATTVSVNNKQASKDAELTIIPQEAEKATSVVDTIEYKNLVAGEEYTVTGTLNKVVGNVATPVATTVEQKVASHSGQGTWTITFNVPSGLEENTKYVVFEEAVSTINLVDKDNDNTPEEKHVVTHKDNK